MDIYIYITQVLNHVLGFILHYLYMYIYNTHPPHATHTFCSRYRKGRCTGR